MRSLKTTLKTELRQQGVHIVLIPGQFLPRDRRSTERGILLCFFITSAKAVMA